MVVAISAKTKTKKPLRYRVTQPPIYSKSVAEYPEYTTRVASNAKFILAANHPDWYEAAGKHEEALNGEKFSLILITDPVPAVF